MKERELFLAALDIEDLAARQAHLRAECAGDADLLARVESLLASHESQSQFLNTPVVQQIANVSDSVASATIVYENGSTQDGDPDATTFYSQGTAPMTKQQDDAEFEIALGYLEPSSKPDSLGRLGHYEVLEVIGRGAFGTVLRAFDEKLHRVVAIKVMSPEMAATSPARKRFIREAQSSAAIRHEHVVSVYAVEESPLPYLVMEFIPGETLQQRLDARGPLDVPTVLHLGRQIAEGLAAAHAQDLIHRDIKPGNILLETSVHDRIKITDFGLARAADDASLTQSGTIAGTPMYMAPEQAMGQRLDQRADLFSFGSVLYQMVSGRPPFRAANTVAVLKRLTEDTPRPIREIIPETPQWLCDIISKLHAKNPDQRYQSAREIADVLANCETQLEAHAGLKDFSLIPQTKPQSVPSRKWVAAAVVLVPLLVLSLTEITGISNLLRRRPVEIITNDPGIKTEVNVAAVAQSESGWVPLFNGNDLTGWKTHPELPGHFEVKEGILIGSQQRTFLFSERGDYENFHLRTEAKINLGGDSGIYFRAGYGIRKGTEFWQIDPAGGFEAQIHKNVNHPFPTGSVSQVGNYAPPIQLGRAPNDSLIRPDEWFTFEIIANQNRIITKVNGKETVSCSSSSPENAKGHIALQVWDSNTAIQFRKIEIKELPTSSHDDSAIPLAITPFDAAQAKAHQEAWAKHLGVPVEYTNSIGMKFVLIPPGEFQMGSTPEEIEAALLEAAEVNAEWKEHVRGEAPRHRVVLTQPFYLGVHEVTQAEYQQLMNANPSYFGPQGDGKDRVAGVDIARFPVEMVSWHDAANFCIRLSEQEAMPPCYSRDGESTKLREGTGYRLPTEAEWEFACRAGTSTKYWSGNDLEKLMQIGWFSENSSGRSHNVGELPANPFGLHDMHGNIWEWVQDGWDPNFYASLNEQTSSNPLNTIDVSPARGARGGNWYVPAVHCRSADRGAFDAKAIFGTVGFRTLLSVDAVKQAIKKTAAAKQESQPTTFTNSIGMEFVKVPKGKSWLGGGKDKLGDREVEIPADFYLGKFEVTQEEWTQVMGENPSHFSRTGEGKDAVTEISNADLMQFPVETVSWDDCQLFVTKLNEREKESDWRYRLPTTTEWEYACRGGPMIGKANSGFDFYFAKPTNNPLREQSSFGKNMGLNRTGKVGSHEANGLGIFDMHRNVWEWCDDKKETPDGNIQRVQMGGGWNHIRWRSAAGNIESELPSHRSNALGLRLARVPAGTP